MDQTNNNQPNPTPPAEETSATPAGTPPSQPLETPAPPTESAMHPSQAGIPTATPVTPPVGAPVQPKKSPMPIIIGAIVVLVIAMGAAYYTFFMKPKAPTAQAPVAQVKTQPKTSSVASQTTKEIQAVDSNASDSSDLQSVQTDINKL